MMEMNPEKRAFIRPYTRQAQADAYPEGLAYSIHFAVSRDGKSFRSLNNNYGILFAEAVIGKDDVICPKGVKNPRILRMENGKYGIFAVRTSEDGGADAESTGKALLWMTENFMEFEAAGLVDQPGNLDELPGDARMGNMVEISGCLCDRIEQHWNRLFNVGVRVPEWVTAGCREEVEGVRAIAVYSDGSTAEKKVSWETDAINFTEEGTYEIRGTVQNEQYNFPLACGYGDPVIFFREGRYYFIATNDNLNDIGLYVRAADDIKGLFGRDIKEHLILGEDEQRGFVQTFWAPEFHVIGGELYILFAVSGRVWGPQCYLMKLKKGGRITEADSWEEPVRIRRKDGSWLSEDGITLDMTYLKTKKDSYVVWSYRRHIGTPADTGSMLYIASVDEAAPWVLTSDPVLLSRPLYGWENVSNTINNEGPHGFVTQDKVYLTYSGGSANGYTYVLGLLSADNGADLLDLTAWEKSQNPVLSFYSVEGEYGPGHNSFFRDDMGNLMIAYHAEDAIDHHLRCDGIRRVHFNIQGEPVFDLSAERDLDPKLREVKMKVKVCSLPDSSDNLPPV